MNFYEHERRNRRLTALLIITFVLLFAALGGGLDVAVAGFGIGGSSLPYLTIGAVLVSLGIAGLGYRAAPIGSCAPCWPSRCVLPSRSTASSRTSPARWRWRPVCRRPRLFVIPDPSPNALAAGRSPDDAAIALTTGTLALLDREETQGSWRTRWPTSATATRR